jgi:indolepyruvate ferredoxin oxidoreductase
LIAPRDPTTGELRKMRFGAWMLPVFRLLKSLRGLRGTAFDPFGYTDERRTERALIAEYEADVEQLLAKLSPANHSLAVQIASIPEDIRGFGHVKTRHLAGARKKHDELIARFESNGTERAAA